MDDFAEEVLQIVEQIPPGQVLAYGDIAEMLGRGGPRQVGQVMSRFGAGVDWWRVVRADGRPARGKEEEALLRLRNDNTPLRGGRVEMERGRLRTDPRPPRA